MSRCNELDKYYTKGALAEYFCNKIEEVVGEGVESILEPSAGGGAFLPPVFGIWRNARKVFVDILPEHPLVFEENFLKKAPEHFSLVVGNPPFGKNSSLAVKFFNKAAEFTPEYICFILPRTFKKPRFWKKLDSNYSLHWQQDCPKGSFTLEGNTVDVPCVMQIWKRQEREDTLPEVCTLFSPIAPSEEGAVFVRRAGSRAGKVVENYTPSSTYSVEAGKEWVEKLEKAAKQVQEVASWTAGVRSITLLEIEDILLERY